MRGTRTLGRYKLQSYATAQEPREYAVLVCHRDTGDKWMIRLAPHVASIDDAERAVELLTLKEIEDLVVQLPPIPKDLPSTRLAGPPIGSRKD
jgi:hypothetical protein